MTTSTSMPTLETRLPEPFLSATCVHCQTRVEYLALPTSVHPSDEPFQLRCAKCGQTWIVRPPKARTAGKRRIGTGPSCRVGGLLPFLSPGS